MITDRILIDFYHFIFFAKWMFLAATILVFADLYFGILAAKKRNEIVKISRAIRRTLNKFASYIIWIILAHTIGQAFSPFGIDLLPLSILVIVYIVELESIYSNYFHSKGKLIKIDIISILRKKYNIESIHKVEEKDELNNNEINNKN